MTEKELVDIISEMIWETPVEGEESFIWHADADDCAVRIIDFLREKGLME